MYVFQGKEDAEREQGERIGKKEKGGKEGERRKMATPMQSRFDCVSISQCILSSSLHLLVLSFLFNLSLSLVPDLNVDLGVTVVMLSNRSISRRSRG